MHDAVHDVVCFKDPTFHNSVTRKASTLVIRGSGASTDDLVARSSRERGHHAYSSAG